MLEFKFLYIQTRNCARHNIKMVFCNSSQRQVIQKKESHIIESEKQNLKPVYISQFKASFVKVNNVFCSSCTFRRRTV